MFQLAVLAVAVGVAAAIVGWLLLHVEDNTPPATGAPNSSSWGRTSVPTLLAI